MIKRDITTELHLLLQECPIVTVLGPRQAGKMTLVRQALPDYLYVSLEDPDERSAWLAIRALIDYRSTIDVKASGEVAVSLSLRSKVIFDSLTLRAYERSFGLRGSH